MSLWLFSRLRGIRPSNLVVLGTVPFFIYLFGSSARYKRALAHILGIEEHPWALLGLFLLTVCGLVLGLFAIKNACRCYTDNVGCNVVIDRSVAGLAQLGRKLPFQYSGYCSRKLAVALPPGIFGIPRSDFSPPLDTNLWPSTWVRCVSTHGSRADSRLAWRAML